MIAKVYLWNNNAVTVFDENGAQIPEFQGMLAQVKSLIIANADKATKFFLASWQEATDKPIPREEFERME